MPPVEHTAENTRAAEEAVYRVDDLIIDVGRQRVTRGETEIPLPHLSFDFLLALARAAPNVLTFDQLIERVWSGLVVSPETVSQRVKLVRDALEDSPHAPRYIAGVRGRGYRMIAPVTPLAAPITTSPGAGAQEGATDRTIFSIKSTPRRWSSAAAAGVGVLLALTGLMAMIFLNTRVSDPRVNGTPEIGEFAPSWHSIAVLPFKNGSAQPEDAYFVDGIHDDILNQLVRLSSLDKVISRTSTERYRGTTKSMRQIGEELGVATILEGGVQRSGNRVRIHVQLIDANDDKHLWAASYDRQLTAENLFAIQSDISREVARALNVVLTDQESEQLQSLPTNNLEAYREYVLGRQEMAKRTPVSVAAAQAHFTNAIERDPEYAYAYTGLADALWYVGQYSGELNDQSQAEILEVIGKALSLDPLSGEAYTSLAMVSEHLPDGPDGLLSEEQAEQYYLKAIQLSPNYATAYHWYSLLLNGLDRREEALSYILKAAELDPMQPILIVNVAEDLLNLGRLDEAHATLLKGIERNPEFPLYYGPMAGKLKRLGHMAEAMKWHRAAVKIVPSMLSYRVIDCEFHLQLGDDQSAEQCYDALEKAFPEAAYPWRIRLYEYRARRHEAAKLLERIAQSEPDAHARRYRSGDRLEALRVLLATSYFYNGQFKKAQAVWQEVAPELFGDSDVVVVSPEIGWSILVACTLFANGQQDRANYLFDQALKTLQSFPGVGYWDVVIHAWRGDRQKALSALREAIDTGWRTNWWRLRSPLFDQMRDEPEWNALIAELEADMDHQRQWFENHQNDPLF